MSAISLRELRASVIDKTAFTVLDDYRRISEGFLTYLASTPPTNIISPLHPNYRFYQFGKEENHKITRPLNSTLYLTDANKFNAAFKRFIAFLNTLRQHQEKTVSDELQTQVRALSQERLDLLSDAIFDFASLREAETWLADQN